MLCISGFFSTGFLVSEFDYKTVDFVSFFLAPVLSLSPFPSPLSRKPREGIEDRGPKGTKGGAGGHKLFSSTCLRMQQRKAHRKAPPRCLPSRSPVPCEPGAPPLRWVPRAHHHKGSKEAYAFMHKKRKKRERESKAERQESRKSQKINPGAGTEEKKMEKKFGYRQN